MEMTVSKNDTRLIESVSQESSWSDIAKVINLGSDIQKYAFNAAVKKGAEEGMFGNEIINKLKESGCTISTSHMNDTLKYYEFKIELSKHPSSEPDLIEPETEAQFHHLTGDTAQEKVEQFNEIEEAVGHTPSRQNVRDYQQTVGEIADIAECESLPQHSSNKGKVKKLISSTEDLMKFREWSKETKGIDVVEDKPKVNLMLLSKERDEHLNTLGSRVPEWKTARKIMIKLLHPDSGGNTLAMQFFKEFDSVMNNLTQAYEYVVFEDNVNKLKQEWLKEQK